MILESGEHDLQKLWGLIQELSESLSENRSLSLSLYSQTVNIKAQAIHAQTGFVLRRFNMDKTQEEYDTELERMNASLAAENYALTHDNKQINALIKEYEQTLETLMSAFRNRAQDVQERELSLIREYENKLLSREEENTGQELAASTAISASLARLSQILRKLMRVEAGEAVEEEHFETALKKEEDDGKAEEGQETSKDASEPSAAELAELSLEREIELARLQAENEGLWQMVKAAKLVEELNGSEARLGQGRRDGQREGASRDGEK